MQHKIWIFYPWKDALTDRTLGYGSLSPAFSIKLYESQDYDKPLKSNESIYIGKTIYSEVNFKITSLKKILQFYVKDCDIEGMDWTETIWITNNYYLIKIEKKIS